MRQNWFYRYGMITLALIVGFVVHLMGMAAIGFILSLYMGGPSSPLFPYSTVVNLFAFGLTVLVAVLAYSITLRLCFGRPLRWRRVAILCSVMIILDFFVSWLLERSLVTGSGSWPLALLPLIWFGGGLFIARDWIVRPDEQRKTIDLVKNFE